MMQSGLLALALIAGQADHSTPITRSRKKPACVTLAIIFKLLFLRFDLKY